MVLGATVILTTSVSNTSRQTTLAPLSEWNETASPGGTTVWYAPAGLRATKLRGDKCGVAGSSSVVGSTLVTAASAVVASTSVVGLTCGVVVVVVVVVVGGVVGRVRGVRVGNVRRVAADDVVVVVVVSAVSVVVVVAGVSGVTPVLGGSSAEDLLMTAELKPSWHSTARRTMRTTSELMMTERSSRRQRGGRNAQE
jgi:hypothetical protein